MIEGLFNQPNYVATKALLDATAMRHQAIASNLANVETPNYKRLDLSPSFESRLKSSIAARNPEVIKSLRPALEVDPLAAPNHDGNTVQVENELLKLKENSVAHAAQTQFITSSMLRMRLAITGRPH